MMLKMEDSGIDSDSKSNCYGAQTADTNPVSTARIAEIISRSDQECGIKFSSDGELAKIAIEIGNNVSENSSLRSESPQSPTHRLISTSQLQKRLEKQILQAKKIRQKEQAFSSENMPKKMLIPRSRLKVPRRNQVPVVTKADSHPLVSWESESDEDEFEFHPMSKKSTREITQQLIKDGYNLDLTPDDEDLDLIPPKPLSQRRCTCCNPVYLCLIQ